MRSTIMFSIEQICIQGFCEQEMFIGGTSVPHAKNTASHIHVLLD